MKNFNFTIDEKRDYVRVKKTFILKDNIVSFLEDLIKKGRVSSLKKKKEGNYTIFTFTTKNQEIIVYVKDKGVHKKMNDFIRTLNTKKLTNFLKKSFVTLGLITYLYPATPSADDYIVEDKIEDFSDFVKYNKDRNRLTTVRTSGDVDEFVVDLKNTTWLKNNEYYIEDVSPYVVMLGATEHVDELEDSLLNMKGVKHGSSEYYDTKTDNINKKALKQKLLENSNAEEFEALSSDEIDLVIDKIYEYIEGMKKIGNFNTKEFVCTLKDVAFYKQVDMVKGEARIYACTHGNDYVVYNLFQTGEASISDEWEYIIYHELDHLNQGHCDCYKSLDLCVNGVSVDINGLDKQPYHYSFLEEAAAEEHASLVASKSVSAYLSENDVLSNLEFALSLDPRYQKNVILNDITKKDPIDFYASFPYLYDEEVELKDYLSMLTCYEYALGSLDSDYVSEEMVGYKTGEYQTRFLYYAYLKNTEIFYKNLYSLNESTDEDLLEFDLMVMDLFEQRMIRTYSSIETMNVGINKIFSMYDDIRSDFGSYLEDKYPGYVYEDYTYTKEEFECFDNYPVIISDETKKVISENIDVIGVPNYKRMSTLFKR